MGRHRENSATLRDAMDMGWKIVTGGDSTCYRVTTPAYNGGDSARSGSVGNSQKSQMEATVVGAGTVSFWWKVSSEADYDWLEFYINGVRQDRISGTVNWQQKSYALTSEGPHSLMWQYVKDSNDTEGWDCGWVDYVQGPGTAPPPPDLLAEAVDLDLSFTTGGDATWSRDASPYSYYDDDAAESGVITDDQSTWMQTSVEGEGTLTFWWKVSSESGCDELEFYLDNTLKHAISGEADWTQKSYNISGSGTHTLKWRYYKDGSVDEGDDRGWVDYVQWSGYMASDPTLVPTVWETITYTYDPAGRRIAKAYDGTTVVKYLYDGDHCLAEYDGSDQFLRKYVYGPGVDQPVCLIETAESNAAYYYHFDGLGSVVALSNGSGNTEQVYEYSVYGQVAASDPNHPNRFMFTGREFDADTGLYYYRARYYNPEIGRFLQTDPIGYGDGMNLYAYCHNRPTICVDPDGRFDLIFLNNGDPNDQQRVRDSMDRVAAICDLRIAELEVALGYEWYCPHHGWSCPLREELGRLRDLLMKMRDGIRSDEPIYVEFVALAGGAAGAYIPAYDYPYDPTYLPDGREPLDKASIWYCSDYYMGDAGARDPNWDWDRVTMHEVSHHYGTRDLSEDERIVDFSSAEAVDDLVLLTTWKCPGWTGFRDAHLCYCTCPPGSVNPGCVVHGKK